MRLLSDCTNIVDLIPRGSHVEICKSDAMRARIETLVYFAKVVAPSLG
jgi:hypothetical protein